MKQICTFLVSFITLFSFSQTGPGGVGSNDGTSSLEFWYMAQDESFSNGDLVDSVIDRSGNARTLSAAATERPTFTSNTAAANNMATFFFDGDDELESTYIGNSNEIMSFGAMFSYDANPANNVIIQHGGRNTMSIRGDNFYADFVGGAAQVSTTPAVANWVFHHKTFTTTGTNRLRYYINNSNSDNFTHTIENRTNNTWIGGQGGGGGTGFNGSIAEVFKFSRVLNTAEQIIIANYFSAKYGTTLSSRDCYNEDNAANGNYDHDVAGIGQSNNGSNHVISRGTGIIQISNPSGLDNNEFLMWGHDNGVQEATELVDVPAPVEARFDRVWRVSEVNAAGNVAVDVGSIDILFDLTNIGSVTASDLRLLVDSDNDGMFNDETPIGGATELSANKYQFAAVTAITNNRRFTLGTINRSQTPLPVELISFNTRLQENKTVKIDWQTATEINNDFFTIERSINGFDWESFAIVDGNGNSNELIKYQSIDQNPYPGKSYYRLKQTDFDGAFAYSSVSSIRVKNVEEAGIQFFPNPAKNQMTILGNAEELQQIKIFNALGQDVTRYTYKTLSSSTKMILDLTELNQSIYYLKTKTTAKTFYKK